jgi:cysteine desulfuration protein SufE
MDALPESLAEIVEDFRLCVGQEKLQYLLQLAESLPPLPGRLQDARDEMEEVPECMTPVYVLAEGDDTRLTYYFDVPAESPTVRGFAALLGQGLNGQTPQEVLAVPADFYLQTGLQSVLSPQRVSGLGAILAHMKKLAVRYLDGGR